MENYKICKNCGGKLIVKATKQSASRLKKPYYYTAYYFCPTCQKLYHDDQFKVENGQGEMFDQGSRIKGQGESPSTSLRIKTHNPSPLTLSAKYDVEIWTDGACTNNGYSNARAAWAFVSGETERAGLVDGRQTNNVAEALAILNALSWAVERGFKKVKLHTDSQISINNLKKPARQVKMNREIFEEIENVIIQNGLKVTYEKVLGHSGDINNERADKLANGLAGKR